MPLLKPPRGIQLNKTHSLARSLVGCWLMNEGAGGKVYDLSGNGNHGTFVGDTHWVPGQHGSCLSFDGSGDAVNIGDYYDGISAITVSAWCRAANAQSSTTEGIVSKRWSSFYGWSLWRDGFEKYNFAIGASGGQASAQSTTVFADTDWHHIVGVYTGSSVHIYVDGNDEDATPGSTSGPITNRNDPVGIGAFWDGADFTAAPWTGQIDNVMIFDRALSAEEIKALYADPFQALRYPLPVELFTYVEAVGDVTVFPDALALTAAIHDPVVALSVVVSPSPLATAASLEAPSVSVSATEEVSALSLDVTLPEAVVRSDVTVDPTALSATTTLPAPQVNYDCGVIVDAGELSSALPAPTVETGQGVQVSAEVLSLGATVHAPALAYDTQQAVSALVLSGTVHAPEVTAGTIVPVGCQSMTAAVQAPGVTYDCQFAVDALGFAVSVEPAVTSYTCSVTPTSLPLTTAVETPVVLYGTIVQAAVQQVQSAIGSVQVAYDFGQSVSVLAMTTQLPPVAVTADMVLDAETQSLHGTVIEPAISTALFQVAWALNLWEK